jgi:hypothetical protein
MLAHLVRSIAFPMKGDFQRAGPEFLGSLAAPLMAGGCLVGSLLSFAVYAISAGDITFYANMRRTYSAFEAWVNRIDLKDPSLASYSHRVSAPADFLSRVWTTAPCMQPLLENGYSKQGGLLDAARMQKIYPFLVIDGIRMEGGQVVIQSRYIDRGLGYTACNGACEHRQMESTCCCCYRIESTYDRVLCCEVGKGSCTSMINPGDSCGIVTCGACGADCCCCYAQENNQVTYLGTGCIGPEGNGCVTDWTKSK